VSGKDLEREHLAGVFVDVPGAAEIVVERARENCSSMGRLGDPHEDAHGVFDVPVQKRDLEHVGLFSIFL